MPPQRRDLHHAFVLALALRHPRHCNMAIHTRRQHKIHAIDIPAIKTPPIRQPHLRRRAIAMLTHHIPAQRTNRHTLHAHTLPLAQKIAPPHPQIDIFRHWSIYRPRQRLPQTGGVRYGRCRRGTVNSGPACLMERAAKTSFIPARDVINTWPPPRRLREDGDRVIERTEIVTKVSLVSPIR